VSVTVIIVAAFCGAVIGFITGRGSMEPKHHYHEDDDYECPAMIQGYNCKGDLCDHSRLAVLEARVAMEKSRLKSEKTLNPKGPKQ
jgi:hypothetical protein